MKDLYALLRYSLAGLRVLLVAVVVCGLAYPLVVTGLAQATLRWQADGSLVTASGAHTTDPSRAIGSALIGQLNHDPSLFYPRPSAAGAGYDLRDTYGSNLGPSDPRLVAAIRARRAAVARREGVPASAVPADAVTASGSGLDPDISPAYAALQVPRVARMTGLGVSRVRALVAEHTSGRTWGVLGAPRVNVLLLDIAVRRAMATR